uniref:Fatty acid synthase n=1 Tax=Romanomermis culicivorax TaxID=13658 RepID=A0A915HP15_ROMCU
MSGRMPESDNMKEFMDNLYNGVDMITEDNRRWEPGFYDLPTRHGKIKELRKFDAGFFGVHPKQAANMDPQLRLLLETSYEAMVDAGVNPQTLRGSNCGVFVANAGSETSSVLTNDPETVVGYSLTGCVRSMMANRISYTYDFRGPSFAVDTACSGALLAFQLAVDAIRQGQCDSALVCGAHVTLTPNSALQFLRLTMLSPDGKCQSFDAKGNGYVRSECVGAIFLQRESVAKRCYANVVHAKSNTDGYKEQGITFPSGAQQRRLLLDTYKEAGLDPRKVVYVEAHGTGTKIGDPQECSAVTSVFCRDRSGPLLIGSVKSNAGHAEPASGIMSLAKVIYLLSSIL